MSAQLQRHDATIRATQSLCPQCQRILRAELYRHEGDVWMRKQCPQHGVHESLYWRDASLFDEMDEIVGDYVFCRTFECLRGTACDRCLPKTFNIMIEVTNRCNLDCPACLSDANTMYSRDPSVEEILARLPAAKPGFLGQLQRPNVVFFGGEPTVRKDLPRLIEAVSEVGYIPRIATNGVRLADADYLDQLADAGLRDVVMQFDGFDEDISETLRGERLLDVKLRALDGMRDRGFRVQLSTMMDKHTNGAHAGRLVEFIGSYPNLRMSIYPYTEQSRYELPGDETHVVDVIELIERQTGGRITRDDWMDTMRLFGRASRFIPAPWLTQKHSILPMPLVFADGDFFPLSRMAKPSFALRRPQLFRQLSGVLLEVMRSPDGRMAPFRDHPFVKILIIEKFHADHSIDLEEASNCHMAFMTKRHYVPFDIFNVVYKKQTPAWGAPKIRRVARTALPGERLPIGSPPAPSG
ncbi:MAG: radical SAM protein [Myxococcota bacterium]|nr:radical SAM protein [Myxococcota bacterium]